MKQVEFYYDYASPTCYLAWTQLPALCERLGAELVRKPILLGGIFKATGNTTPVNLPPKRAWMFDDMKRYARHYGVAFEENPHFVFNSLPAMRAAIWTRTQGCLEAFDKALFEAAWVRGIDIGDVEALGGLASELGLDPAEVAAGVQDPAVKKALIDETNAAVELGAFGAPTFFVAGEMHFGQDRLDWIERALSKD